MRWDVVVLSGQIATGKSTLARNISDLFAGVHISTSSLLKKALEQRGVVTTDRVLFQSEGESLDRDTNGSWVAEVIPTPTPGSVVVVDSIRVAEQVASLRSKFGPGRVFHIHLIANDDDLKARFENRGEIASYEVSKSHHIEAQVDSLSPLADLVCDTSRLTPDDILYMVAGYLGYRSNHGAKLVDVIVGAQYGSEGKGHVVSYIAPEYDYLVRVGGANAGHTVVYDGGKTFAFKLIPSGTIHAPNSKVVMGPGSNLDVEILLKEIDHCGLTPDRLFIDPQANIVLELDRIQEDRLKSIGSTQQGVGNATARRILNRNVGEMVMARDIPELKEFIRPTISVMDEAFRLGKRVLLEGTQGTGLSLYHGPYPYVTSRDTTVSGCLSESGIAPTRVRKSIITVRTNPIRVQSPDGGTSGPMSRETTWEEISLRAGVDADTLRQREKTTTTKRLRRVSEFDWALLQKAISLNGPTDIALTFVDYVSVKNANALRYDQLTPETRSFIETVESTTSVPVTLISTGFNERSVIDRRSNW